MFITQTQTRPRGHYFLFDSWRDGCKKEKKEKEVAQRGRRIILSTTMEAIIGYGEEEENQDHEFTLFLDIFFAF